MDKTFHGISIGLYQRDIGSEIRYIVHTYSRCDGAITRIEDVAGAMEAIGGMSRADATTVQFSCGQSHLRMCRRLFIEATRIKPDDDMRARPLVTYDEKTDRAITAIPSGAGGYRVLADGPEEGGDTRAKAVARGLAKLTGMVIDTQEGATVRFECGADHRAALGLLLVRALNVRVAMRESDGMSARGILAAPSQGRE